jgi:hypothetical protein
LDIKFLLLAHPKTVGGKSPFKSCFLERRCLNTGFKNKRKKELEEKVEKQKKDYKLANS